MTMTKTMTGKIRYMPPPLVFSAITIYKIDAKSKWLWLHNCIELPECIGRWDVGTGPHQYLEDT